MHRSVANSKLINNFVHCHSFIKFFNFSTFPSVHALRGQPESCLSTTLFLPLLHNSIHSYTFLWTSLAILKEKSAMNFCRLHFFRPSISNNSTLFFFGALQQRSRHVGNSLSRFMRVMADVDPICRRAKVSLTLLPAASPKTTSVGRNRYIALIY